MLENLQRPRLEILGSMEQTSPFVATDLAAPIIFKDAKAYCAGLMNGHGIRNPYEKTRLENSHCNRLLFDIIEVCRCNKIYELSSAVSSSK